MQWSCLSLKRRVRVATATVEFPRKKRRGQITKKEAETRKEQNGMQNIDSGSVDVGSGKRLKVRSRVRVLGFGGGLSLDAGQNCARGRVQGAPH